MRSTFLVAVLASAAVRSIVVGCNGPTFDYPKDMFLDVQIITDPQHTKQFPSKEEALTYLYQFWNSVLLRFSAADPRLRLSLANITLLNDSSYETRCFDFLINLTPHKKVHKNHTFLNLNTSMPKLQECLEEMSPRGSGKRADMIYVMTGHEPRYVDPRGNWKPYTGSAAKRGGVCTAENYAIGWDIPHTFFGVLTAVRQLAYLMGSDLARRRANPIVGCRAVDGFIMSDIEYGPGANMFSGCSMQEMEAALKNISDECRNRSFPDLTNKTMAYPGDNRTHDQHCKAIESKFHYCYTYRTRRNCETPCCLTVKGVTLSGTAIDVPSWDGEGCGSGEVCFDGNCIYPKDRPEYEYKE